MEAVEKAARAYTRTELTELLRRAQEGSPGALEEFFAFLRERMLVLARRRQSLGLRAADIEDVVQEAMLAVHEHLPRLRTWEDALRLARGVLRNQLSVHARYRRSRDPLEVPLEEVVRSCRVEVHPETTELERILEQALDELYRINPQYAAVLRGICNGLSKKELCRILGIASNRFDALLYRSRRTLRRLLKERWGIEW
ncbi:hypothetical protein HRbin08_01908 [bacterium HR08]|nr:hypothetical protein HRbin08_01908 [bacterium HR08]